MVVRGNVGRYRADIADDRTTLDNLYKFLTEVDFRDNLADTSPGRPLSPKLPFYGSDIRPQPRFTVDRLDLPPVIGSKRMMSMFYGPYGLLSLEVRTRDEQQLDRKMLDEADSLQAFLAEHGWKGSVSAATGSPTISPIEDARNMPTGKAIAKQHLMENTVPSLDLDGRVVLEAGSRNQTGLECL